MSTACGRWRRSRDYLTINISSPNTPGLAPAAGRGRAERAARGGRRGARADGPPIFLKVAPDLGEGEPDQIVRVAIDHGIDAIIVANTTVSRPAAQVALSRASRAGLSGAPLKPLALKALREFRAASGGEIPLIGVGGIANADDAWERIRAGASLVQLYTAMVYEGPGIARRIARGPCRAAEARGLRQHCRGGRDRVAPRRCASVSLHSSPACCVLAGCATAQLPLRRPPARPRRGMVSAADPRAAEAGAEMLRKGGSAADAAFATLLALNVVEPQSSGIGGGGYLVYAERGGAPVTFDGRETAPHAATADLVLQGRPADGASRRAARREERRRARQRPDDGASPTQRYGKLPWAALFQPAIRLAARRVQDHAAAAQCAADNNPRPARCRPRPRAIFYQAERQRRSRSGPSVEEPGASRLPRAARASAARTASTSVRTRRRSPRRSAARRTIRRR